ncbi:hypothetical protein [[Phormidium ambiguum] IAM M-71]|uniref:hypothetical protein n=1 Tax=[Phormidium ambiguum] IAM M-71 TaxID=454136 RepID=UPI0015C0318F|nr:hypothetical protein [Phormidium ambiguum]
MESLAYIHIALEYENSEKTQFNSEQFICQSQTTKTTLPLPLVNWLSLKLFGWLHHKPI